jgi:hypothetical protein
MSKLKIYVWENSFEDDDFEIPFMVIAENIKKAIEKAGTQLDEYLIRLKNEYKNRDQIIPDYFIYTIENIKMGTQSKNPIEVHFSEFEEFQIKEILDIN